MLVLKVINERITFYLTLTIYHFVFNYDDDYPY